MDEEERQRAQNDGDIELYSSFNQVRDVDSRIDSLVANTCHKAQREALFESDPEVNRLLDAWWRAATIYLDSDHSETLSKDE